MKAHFKTLLLLCFFSLCAIAVVVTHRVRERFPAPLPRELYSAVSRQLIAFRSADFPGAYRNASSAVQQKFTLPQFEAMVRRSYAEMTRDARVEFGPIENHGATAIMPVYFFGPNSRVRPYLYTLAAERGGWKIESVEPLGAAPAGVLLPGMQL